MDIIGQHKKIERSIDCPVVVLVGPTAIGKTALSFEFVEQFDCEIISMDSMQVYRYMDIGTAKPDAQEQEIVKHHLINIINPDEQYDAARFVTDALTAIDDIASRNHVVLLTGGTGLYLKALLDGLFSALPVDLKIRESLENQRKEKGNKALHEKLCQVDPDSGARIHPHDSQRVIRGLEIFHSSGKSWTEHLQEQQRQSRGVRFSNMYQVALTCEKKELHKRIEQRTEIMLQNGLIDEVKELLNMGYSQDLSSMQSIGYRHANNFIAGAWDYKTMTEHLIRDTKKYAKRQMTWFTKNATLHWFDRTETLKICNSIKQNIKI